MQCNHPQIYAHDAHFGRNNAIPWILKIAKCEDNFNKKIHAQVTTWGAGAGRGRG